jgi:hypothetical protein
LSGGVPPREVTVLVVDDDPDADPMRDPLEHRWLRSPNGIGQR